MADSAARLAADVAATRKSATRTPHRSEAKDRCRDRRMMTSKLDHCSQANGRINILIILVSCSFAIHHQICRQSRGTCDSEPPSSAGRQPSLWTSADFAYVEQPFPADWCFSGNQSKREGKGSGLASADDAALIRSPGHDSQTMEDLLGRSFHRAGWIRAAAGQGPPLVSGHRWSVAAAGSQRRRASAAPGPRRLKVVAPFDRAAGAS